MFSLLSLVSTHKLDTLHTILSTGSPLKPQSYEYVYTKIKEDVLLGSISGKFRLVYLHVLMRNLYVPLLLWNMCYGHINTVCTDDPE